MSFKTMGVINVTPNSFSDGGKLKYPKHSFDSIASDFDIIDVGAESTAPFNKAISAGRELGRLIGFFSEVLDAPDQGRVISIDTYRPEVFYEVGLEILRVWPRTKLIFNDVSGKVDNDLLELMKTELPFSYVFSHNLCPERDDTSHHMEYLFSGNIEAFFEEVLSFFNNGLEKLRPMGRKVVIDPCFGFSKTREQSLYLLNRLSEFSSRLGGEEELLIGVSRKSFLRRPKNLDAKLPSNQEKLDHLQSIIAFQLLNQIQREMIFRSHKPYGFKAIKDAYALLTN